MENNVLIAALAGLLHDIGKFSQRAGVGVTRTWDQEAKRDYKYKHALLTADFVDKFVPEPWRVEVKNMAGNHHRPTNHREGLIRLADQFSAGERAHGGEPGDDEKTVHPRQLQRIFCSLDLDGEKTPEVAYWPIAALQLEETVFFQKGALEEEKVWNAYEQLWGEFKHEAAELKSAYANTENLAAFIESNLLLMQRYTWCIPSAYFKSLPDVSLYDHGRMTASLAAIFVQDGLSREDADNLLKDPKSSESELAYLIDGDLSGVQDFIYTITSRGATSALRGRSFYLQILTEAIARYVLHVLELPATNLIYAGGGHFYLLAGRKAAQKLDVIRANISRILYLHHRGDLYLALESIPLFSKDFFDGEISRKWLQLSQRVQGAKQQRFSELGIEIRYLFKPQGHGGNQDLQCQVCGLEHPETKAYGRSPENPEGVRKCPPCFSYEQLGDLLRKARYLIYQSTEATDLLPLEGGPHPGDWKEVLKAFGASIDLQEEIPEEAHTNHGHKMILALNDEAFTVLKPASNVVTGRRFLVNVTPVITEPEIKELRQKGIQDLPVAGSVKPFHALQAHSEGINRLGIMRMDIDNLGKIFSEGLGEKATLSRVASLSFAVSLFFEGWVGYLATRRNKKGFDRLYSIYSGGDDLFFVGAWDEVVELGREIRSDLGHYVADHPGVHASAGIVLVGGKYPLSQAAGEAYQAEARAKDLSWRDRDGRQREKDAVNFLGQTLPWEKFGLGYCYDPGIENAHALMHQLKDMVETKGINRSLLRRLIRLHERYLEAAEKRRRKGDDRSRSGEPQVLWGPWNWLGYYTLTRMVKQMDKHEYKEEVEKLRDQLKKDEFRSMEWIGLAARWAELISRK